MDVSRNVSLLLRHRLTDGAVRTSESIRTLARVEIGAVNAPAVIVAVDGGNGTLGELMMELHFVIGLLNYLIAPTITDLGFESKSKTTKITTKINSLHGACSLLQPITSNTLTPLTSLKPRNNTRQLNHKSLMKDKLKEVMNPYTQRAKERKSGLEGIMEV